MVTWELKINLLNSCINLSRLKSSTRSMKLSSSLTTFTSIDTLPFILHHELNCISLSASCSKSFVSSLCKKLLPSAPVISHIFIDLILQRNGAEEDFINLNSYYFLVQDLISRMCLDNSGSSGSDLPVNQSYKSRSFTSSKLSVS